MSKFELYRLERKEIEELSSKYIMWGCYKQSFLSDLEVKGTGDNELWNINDCLTFLDKPLEFGNIGQIRAVEALNFINLELNKQKIIKNKSILNIFESLQKYYDISFDF